MFLSSSYSFHKRKPFGGCDWGRRGEIVEQQRQGIGAMFYHWDCVVSPEKFWNMVI